MNKADFKLLVAGFVLAVVLIAGTAAVLVGYDSDDRPQPQDTQGRSLIKINELLYNSTVGKGTNTFYVSLTNSTVSVSNGVLFVQLTNSPVTVSNLVFVQLTNSPVTVSNTVFVQLTNSPVTVTNQTLSVIGGTVASVTPSTTVTGAVWVLPWDVYKATPTTRTDGQGGPMLSDPYGNLNVTGWPIYKTALQFYVPTGAVTNSAALTNVLTFSSLALDANSPGLVLCGSYIINTNISSYPIEIDAYFFSASPTVPGANGAVLTTYADNLNYQGMLAFNSFKQMGTNAISISSSAPFSIAGTSAYVLVVANGAWTNNVGNPQDTLTFSIQKAK